MNNSGSSGSSFVRGHPVLEQTGKVKITRRPSILGIPNVAPSPGGPVSPRSFTRVPVHIRASIRTADGDQADGIVRDLSLNGLSIAGRHSAAPGSPCTIRLHLEAAEIRIPVHAVGRVARNDGSVLAAHIDHVDAEDVEHFNRLVLYNAPDASALEAELSRRPDGRRLAGPGLRD
jgi:hypothetical protein